MIKYCVFRMRNFAIILLLAISLELAMAARRVKGIVFVLPESNQIQVYLAFLQVGPSNTKTAVLGLNFLNTYLAIYSFTVF